MIGQDFTHGAIRGETRIWSWLAKKHPSTYTIMPAFRQVGEKQLPNPVLCMAWSPKTDLIALPNTAGEWGRSNSPTLFCVWHGLQRRISLPSQTLLASCYCITLQISSVCLPPNENTGKEITVLAWRPDGKILAFSLRDTKLVVLCDAEILHLFPVENPVSCMCWLEVLEESSVFNSSYTPEDEGRCQLT
ncbi:hypothetical protein J4Q44_G00203610 [Coregonus suidteri]|uniref:Anaphase-promoting complex subunit 4-like WD40 domain-containing protein n=1 Tax=Coregonus suidteri TaxID=861788 RepID=A0AAN8QS34_9TELE